MKDPEMTLEDMERLLREHGVEPGRWGQVGGSARPAFMGRQAAHLERLKTILEGVVENKQAETEAIREKITRLKHGGGR